eukprot:4863728-Prymnesium_polylepis.1
MSSCPVYRCSTHAHAASSSVYSVTPSARASPRSRSASSAGSVSRAAAPPYVLTGGRGLSVGIARTGSSPPSSVSQ